METTAHALPLWEEVYVQQWDIYRTDIEGIQFIKSKRLKCIKHQGLLQLCNTYNLINIIDAVKRPTSREYLLTFYALVIKDTHYVYFVLLTFQIFQ